MLFLIDLSQLSRVNTPPIVSQLTNETDAMSNFLITYVDENQELSMSDDSSRSSMGVTVETLVENTDLFLEEEELLQEQDNDGSETLSLQATEILVDEFIAAVDNITATDDEFADNAEDEDSVLETPEARLENRLTDLEADLNAISDIALYPKYGSFGTVGHVHYNRVFLEISYSGPDGRLETLGQIVDNDANNCLVTQVHREHADKCIHGGQIYNPIALNANFVKMSTKISSALGFLPVWVSEYLCSNRPGATAIPDNVQKIVDVMKQVDMLTKRWIKVLQYTSNPRLRTELTMVHEENSCTTLVRLPLFWPTCNESIYSDFRHMIFFVPQHCTYANSLEFCTNNCQPLVNLMKQEKEQVLSYSSETKTRLVWCAEKIVREFSNTFFVGRIHSKIKNTCRRYGKFCVHNELKTTIPVRDQLDLGIGWGIKTSVYCLNFKKKSGTDKHMERLNLLNTAIVKYHGKLDFPHVAAEYNGLLWLTTQRFSMNLSKHDDIGVFDEVLWDELATMNCIKLDKYVQTMMRIVLLAYRKNWMLILKQYKHGVTQMDDVPVCNSDIREKFLGKLFVTTHGGSLPDDCNNNLVRKSERAPIHSVGKYL
jgi:hypothetical protein